MSGTQKVDEYLAALPDDRRRVMQQLRDILVAGAPEAEEAISYKMPALRWNDRFFMSYDAFKGHYSLFPSTDAMEKELGDDIQPYLSGKGTLRFASDKPLPANLIGRIVAIRRREFSSES